MTNATKAENRRTARNARRRRKYAERREAKAACKRRADAACRKQAKALAACRRAAERLDRAIVNGDASTIAACREAVAAALLSQGSFQTPTDASKQRGSKYLPERLAAAWHGVGGLSAPSKMPSWGYSLSAHLCNVGSQLRTVADSTCAHCYAMKGRYLFETVQRAMARRFRSLASPHWRDHMTALLSHYCRTDITGCRWFRWHDSGDIQSAAHLGQIADVAERTPNIWHWLPTREAAIVAAFGALPDNLCVRLSAPLVNQAPALAATGCGSGVHTADKALALAERGGLSCIAYDQNGMCGTCRACWLRAAAWISYPIH